MKEKEEYHGLGICPITMQYEKECGDCSECPIQLKYEREKNEYLNYFWWGVFRIFWLRRKNE